MREILKCNTRIKSSFFLKLKSENLFGIDNFCRKKSPTHERETPPLPKRSQNEVAEWRKGEGTLMNSV